MLYEAKYLLLQFTLFALACQRDLLLLFRGSPPCLWSPFNFM